MSRFRSGDMAATMPVYVTRKTASGGTGSLSMSIWMALSAMSIVWFNVVLWGLYSLLLLASLVISAIF